MAPTRTNGEPNGLAHLLNPAPARDDVRSHIYNHNTRNFSAYEENGRLYHAWNRGLYLLPCDDKERARCDMLHHLVYAVILGNRDNDGTALAKPIKEQVPYSVLDIGTGSGIWPTDISTRYPEAEVLGGDIVGGQPETRPNLQWRTPDAGPNAGFDLEAPSWGFAFNSFDLVHAAHLCGSVSDWPALYAKIFRHLRPRTGQFEYLEIDMKLRCDDGSVPPNNVYDYWWDHVQVATRGKSLAYRADTGRLLAQAGFVDIEERVYLLPFSAWKPGRRQEAFWYRNLLLDNAGFEPVSMINGLSMAPLTRNLGWTKADVDRLVKDVLEFLDTSDVSYQAYHKLHIWTARRPGPEEG